MAAFERFNSDSDSRTQSTAVDALSSKYSSNSVGYFEDPFLKQLVEANFPSHSGRINRKPPIINRGYYGRVESINQLIGSFLVSTESLGRIRQIVSIGCGFDTNSILICSRQIPNIQLFEVDFGTIISRKVDMFIKNSSICKVLFTDDNINETTGTNPRARTKDALATEYGYKLGSLNLLSLDIREENALCRALLASGADPTMPTLFITECVLVYINKDIVNALTRSIAQSFLNAAWVSYDMINPNDSFGRTMLNNLRAARHNVPGLTEFPTLESHSERYTSTGWDHAKSITMLTAYNTLISAENKSRIARLEIFDEIEEWELIMQHYAFTVAVTSEVLLPMLSILP